MPPYQTPAVELEPEPEYAPDVPLLDLESPGLNDDDDAAGSIHSHAEPAPNYRFSRWGIHSPRRIVVLVALIKFSVVLSGMLLFLPFARILEDMMCHVHYQDTSLDMIDEMKCKVDEVQARLGYFYGWNSLLSSIVGMRLLNKSLRIRHLTTS